jgi:hypothetical protein
MQHISDKSFKTARRWQMHRGLPWWGGELGSSTRILQLAANPIGAPSGGPSETTSVGEVSDVGVDSSSTSTSNSSSRRSTSQLELYECSGNDMLCKLSFRERWKAHILSTKHMIIILIFLGNIVFAQRDQIKITLENQRTIYILKLINLLLSILYNLSLT